MDPTNKAIALVRDRMTRPGHFILDTHDILPVMRRIYVREVVSKALAWPTRLLVISEAVMREKTGISGVVPLTNASDLRLHKPGTPLVVSPQQLRLLSRDQQLDFFKVGAPYDVLYLCPDNIRNSRTQHFRDLMALKKQGVRFIIAGIPRITYPEHAFSVVRLTDATTALPALHDWMEAFATGHYLHRDSRLGIFVSTGWRTNAWKQVANILEGVTFLLPYERPSPATAPVRQEPSRVS